MKVLVRWACVWMFTSMGMREVSMTVISLCEYLTNGGKNETHQKVFSHGIMLWRWLRFQRSPCLASGRTTWAPSRHPSVTLRKSYPIRIFLASTRNFSQRRIQISRSLCREKTKVNESSTCQNEEKNEERRTFLYLPHRDPHPWRHGFGREQGGKRKKNHFRNEREIEAPASESAFTSFYISQLPAHGAMYNEAELVVLSESR